MLVGLGKQGLCCTCKWLIPFFSRTRSSVSCSLPIRRARTMCQSRSGELHLDVRQRPQSGRHDAASLDRRQLSGKVSECAARCRWSAANVGCSSRCDRCKKSIKTYNGIAGLHCRWCQLTLHKKCASQVKPECTLGPNRDHVIPPSCISPAVLVRSPIDLAVPWTCRVRMASGTADRAAQWQRFATR